MTRVTCRLLSVRPERDFRGHVYHQPPTYKWTEKTQEREVFPLSPSVCPFSVGLCVKTQSPSYLPGYDEQRQTG